MAYEEHIAQLRAEMAELDRRAEEDRKRRWRMCQQGGDLLADLYPNGIDSGSSYRDKFLPMNERRWKGNIAVQKPKAMLAKPASKWMPSVASLKDIE